MVQVLAFNIIVIFVHCFILFLCRKRCCRPHAVAVNGSTRSTRAALNTFTAIDDPKTESLPLAHSSKFLLFNHYFTKIYIQTKFALDLARKKILLRKLNPDVVSQVRGHSSLQVVLGCKQQHFTQLSCANKNAA